MVKEAVKEPAKEAVEGSPKIYVTGLPLDISKSTLNTFFSDHGKVLDVIFKFGSDSKRIKGVAYILFESEETVEKLLALKTVTIEEKEVEIKKLPEGEGQKDDEPLLAIPKEALKCYVCKREKFPSVEAYLNHRKGKQHQAVYRIFRAKSSSVFQLLKAEAKLASDRAYDNMWMKKHPKPSQCDVCQCQLYCKPEKHEFTVEHKMVKNYNNQKCCEHTYTERQKYEAHLLSLRHLKNVYEKEQQKETDTDDGRPSMKKAIDVFKQCDADLKELKETYGELDLNAELPEFDPNNPIGLNYIVKKINYHCICCDQKFFAHINLVEPHCRSYNHYANMTDYIVGVDKKIAQKRKMEETETKPNKKRTLSQSNGAVVKKGTKTENEEDKSTNDKEPDVKKDVKKKAADDEEDEEMDTNDKSNDEGDVDQPESKDLDEDQEEGDEDQEEMVEEEPEEEPAEDQEDQEEQEDQEVAEDSDIEEIQPEEEEADSDIEEIQPEEEEAEVATPTKEKVSAKPVEEDTKEAKEEVAEEDEEEEEEQPKPTRAAARSRGRGRRARGRGRGIKF